MEVVRGRFIFTNFKKLVNDLIFYSREKQYYDLVVDFSNQIYKKNYYASREIIKEIKKRLFIDCKTNYAIHEVIGKLEQKLKNKLDKVYYG